MNINNTEDKLRKINAKLISLCNHYGLHGIARKLRKENKRFSSGVYVSKKSVIMRKWHLFEKRLEFKP